MALLGVLLGPGFVVAEPLALAKPLPLAEPLGPGEKVVGVDDGEDPEQPATEAEARTASVA